MSFRFHRFLGMAVFGVPDDSFDFSFTIYGSGS